MEKLAARFQAAARLSHAASSILNQDELLPQVVDLIRDEFGYDYVGILLIDERQEWAVLQAATGKAGRRMMESGYRVRVGDDSMIGWCLANQRTRVALSIEKDAVRFADPSMPRARSALALPLLSRGCLVGAMTIQSAQSSAFSKQDVAILQTMADQLANAIENARLYTEAMQRTADLSALLEASAVLEETQQSSSLLARRVNEIACLNEIGRKIDETPPVPDLLEWVAERIPSAMQHPALCVVAIEFQGQIYGKPEALRLPYQMVQGLRIGDEQVGKIYIAYTQRYDFLNTESAMLGDIVRRVSGYIEKQNALTEAEALYQATADLTAARSLEEIVNVLRSHTLLGKADRSVSLNLFDRPWVGDDALESIVPAARWTQGAALDDARFALHQFPSASRLLQPDRLTIITDIETDPRLDEKTRALYLEQFGVRSTIAVPLVVGGQWLGFIDGLFSKAVELPESELRRLAALAGQAAVIIQNLRQLAETQARARREQLLREITARVRGLTDPDTLARAAVRELGTALGRPVFIRLGSAEELSQESTAGQSHEGDEEGHGQPVSIRKPSGGQADLTRSRKSEGGE